MNKAHPLKTHLLPPLAQAIHHHTLSLSHEATHLPENIVTSRIVDAAVPNVSDHRLRDASWTPSDLAKVLKSLEQ